MIDVNNHLTFQTELQGVQLAEVKDKLSKIGDITDEQALKLVEQDEEVFKSIYIIHQLNIYNDLKSLRIRI